MVRSRRPVGARPGGHTRAVPPPGPPGPPDDADIDNGDDDNGGDVDEDEVVVGFIPNPGYSLDQARVNVIGPILYKIAREENGIDPQRVLEEAANEDSPLHTELEWNNARAAHSWRLQQCARLIRSFQILMGRRHADGHIEQTHVRALLYVKWRESRSQSQADAEAAASDAADPSVTRPARPTRRGFYKTVSEIAEDQDLEEQVLQSLRRRLHALRLEFQRYRTVFPNFATHSHDLWLAIEHLTDTHIWPPGATLPE